MASMMSIKSMLIHGTGHFSGYNSGFADEVGCEHKPADNYQL
jgi:hypothetical protein